MFQELSLKRQERKDVEGKERLGKDAEGSLRTQRSTGKTFHDVKENQRCNCLLRTSIFDY